MIAVIADDFTGAAEIGGIGLRYGLKVVIETEVKNGNDADLLVIVSDTRSLSPKNAALKIEKIAEELLNLQPEYIYKKLDSVLRGNIAAELSAQMRITGKQRAVIIAGNPLFKRFVKDGIYTIQSIPLAKTSFAEDPEFPVKSSSVTDIIGDEYTSVYSCKIDCCLPEEGLIIGDINNQDEFLNWTGKIDNETIASGGSGFFDVLLSTKYSKLAYTPNGHLCLGEKSLFVFGSTFPKTKKIVNRLNKVGIIKMNMPDEIYYNINFDHTLLDKWAQDVASCLNTNKKVIITIEQTNNEEPGLSVRIKKYIGELVNKVSELAHLSDLVIEGGATSSEILKSLHIEQLFPSKEIDFGIIQMKVDKYPGLKITTKPGSYSWPDSVFFDNSMKQV